MSTVRIRRRKRSVSSVMIASARAASRPAIHLVRSRHLLQVVDVVQEHPFQPIHFRVHIAGHRNIDHEHRLVLPPMQNLLRLRHSQNLPRRSRRRNDDVRLVCPRVQVIKVDRLPQKLLRQLHRALVRAIRHHHRIRAVLHQVPRRQLAHLARADDQNLLAFERSKNPPGQVHRHRRNRNR